MGYTVHHAIIVTSIDDELLKKAHNKARKLFHRRYDLSQYYVAPVSEIIDSSQNGHASFFVGPDGSKEGWTASDEGDKSRQEFVDWLEKHRDEDGSTSLDYVEVQFADEGGEDKILQSTNVIGEVVDGS